MRPRRWYPHFTYFTRLEASTYTSYNLRRVEGSPRVENCGVLVWATPNESTVVSGGRGRGESIKMDAESTQAHYREVLPRENRKPFQNNRSTHVPVVWPINFVSRTKPTYATHQMCEMTTGSGTKTYHTTVQGSVTYACKYRNSASRTRTCMHL